MLAGHKVALIGDGAPPRTQTQHATLNLVVLYELLS